MIGSNPTCPIINNLSPPYKSGLVPADFSVP